MHLVDSNMLPAIFDRIHADAVNEPVEAVKTKLDV